MLSHPIFTPSHLSMSVFIFACIFGAARAFEFDFEFDAKCADTYCSLKNNPQFLDQDCCTFGSVSDCSCCLPNKNGVYSSKCSDTWLPTWESCVNSWSTNCCVSIGGYYYRPGYKGVDWVSDASCCQLCNGGSWNSWKGNGLLIPCDPSITPQLLCSSKDDSDNTMLRHGVKAEE
uniref:C-type lectin domain-containing protein n=1 Tax=Ditylum brightwellii TaxID=49249 RepID=A0A7S4RK73_9STRA